MEKQCSHTSQNAQDRNDNQADQTGCTSQTEQDSYTCPACARKKERGDEEYRALMNRLSRIEGQIRGIKGMLEKDAYCIDILRQSAAASAAINSFNKELLDNHIRTCVAQDIRDGNDETIDELVGMIHKLMK